MQATEARQVEAHGLKAGDVLRLRRGWRTVTKVIRRSWVCVYVTNRPTPLRLYWNDKVWVR